MNKRPQGKVQDDEPEHNDFDPKLAGKIKKLGTAIVATANTQDQQGRELTASEKEEAIKAHQQILKKLTPAERQKVEEYYRYLRDIKDMGKN